MATIGSLVVKIGTDLAPLQKGLAQTKKMTGAAVRSIGKGMALGAAGGVTLLGAGIGKVGIEAFSMATDVETATKKIQTALGVTAEQAEELGQVGLGVFKNNFTDSVGEATAAVGMTALQLKHIDSSELGIATENALKLSDAFDTDLGQTLNAANVLMDQFGLSQALAFDFLSSGFQRGLDNSGDFLDSIGEYGNLFGQAGADAGQFFSMLETGLAGGIHGTDRAGDMFKEFTIRIQEGTKGQRAALESLGVDTETFYAGLSDGSITIVDAFAAIQQSIAKIKDPLQQQAVGVELMGTQFEDLGANAVAGIDMAATSMEDLSGSTQTLDSQYDTLGAKFETLQRKAQAALAPIGEILVEGLTNAMPKIEALADFLIETVTPAFGNAFESLQTGMAVLEESGAITTISDSFVRIGEALGVIEEGSTGSQAAMQLWTDLLGTMETAVQAGVLIIGGIAATMETIATATEASVEAFNNLKDGLAAIKVPDSLQAIADKVSGIVSAASSPVFSWFVENSPVPLAEGLKAINAEARRMPDLASQVGLDRAAPLAGIVSPTADSGAAAGPDAPTVINLVVDGQVIESIVSSRQGIKRQQRAAIGGATAL
jgi:TP901 family phage tail tape measure protein